MKQTVGEATGKTTLGFHGMAKQVFGGSHSILSPFEVSQDPKGFHCGTTET